MRFHTVVWAIWKVLGAIVVMDTWAVVAVQSSLQGCLVDMWYAAPRSF